MIPWAKPDFYGYEEKYLKQALKSTWISDGSFIKKLEKNFSSYLKSKESIAVSNGTSAIHLIYMALNLKKMMKLLYQVTVIWLQETWHYKWVLHQYLQMST